MLFESGNRLYDLANPIDFLRFPMSFLDKVRFTRLMLHAFGRSDWERWHDASAAEIVDRYGSPGVRRALFEPLTQLKFQLPCSEVSGSWLSGGLGAARLHPRHQLDHGSVRRPVRHADQRRGARAQRAHRRRAAHRGRSAA
jgi:protoporphyrinogen oxidase